MTAEKLPNFQTLLVDELGNVTGTIANPLITSSSGGGGGTVDQGTPNTAPNAWGIRLSNGTIFYDTVLGTQLPNSLIDGRLSVYVGASVLPPDAATATNQATGNTSLDNIDTKLTTTNAKLENIDGKLTNPLPVSLSAIPLATDAATATNQTTGNSSLSSIDGKVATSAKQDTGNTSLSNIDTKLTTTNSSLASIIANQTNKTQSSQITDGTNTVALLNAAPIGTEWGLGVRLIGSSVTVSNFPTDDDAGTPASAVPSKANYIGGVDSNNLLRGFAANADNDANPSSGKLPTLPAVVKNSAPTLVNNKLAPLWVGTDGRLQTLALINDGTNNITVKAASTPPVTTDTGLVVSIGPNSVFTDIGTPNTTAPTKTEQVGGIDSGGLLQTLAIGGDNSANPTTGKLKVLPTKANATKQTYTEGRNAPLSVDLNGYLRSVVKLEQPATFAVFTKVTTPAANSSVLSIASSNAATKKIVLKNIYLINVQSLAITGVNNEFQLLKFNSHNAGTALTPIAQDSTDILSGTTTVRTGANITGENASILKLWFLNGDEIIAGPATNQGTQAGISQFAPDLNPINIKQPTIRPGEGMHIKCITSATNVWAVGVIFTEEDI